MDRFEVRGNEQEVLEESELMNTFEDEEASAYVLIVQGVPYAFDGLEGGVYADGNTHIFHLSEPHGNIPQNSAGIYELHFDNCSYSLYTNNSIVFGDEDEPFLIMEVIDYERHENGFAAEMVEKIDETDMEKY
jgi:hypothetical protein